MMINERKPEFDRVKEVKVKIPVSYHIKLHSMKVLTGKQISDAITEALDVYFQAKRPEFMHMEGFAEFQTDSTDAPAAP